MKTLTLEEWRQRHPRCIFCHYLKYVAMPAFAYCSDNGYYDCKVKDKIIRHPNIPRPWCPCYKVKEENNSKEKAANA